MVKILILTTCTKEKRINVEHKHVANILKDNKLPIPTFNLENESIYRKHLKDYILPAIEMYQGHIRYFKLLIEELTRCGIAVKMYILSARYGIIEHNDLVIPYNVHISTVLSDENFLRKWISTTKIEVKLKGIASELSRNSQELSTLIIALTSPYIKLLQRINCLDILKSIKSRTTYLVIPRSYYRCLLSSNWKTTILYPVKGIGSFKSSVMKVVNNVLRAYIRS